MVFFSSRISPFTSTVIFLDRSPLATAVVTSAMLRTWAVRLPAIEFTESVRSFQVPATPFTSAWPPSLPSVPTSRATRVTSEAKAPSCSHHRVDGLGGAQELALQRPAVDLERHRLGQVALRHGADHARHFGRRVHQVVDQRVDAIRPVAPEAARVGHRGALLELAFLADHARQPRQFLGHAQRSARRRR